MKKALTWLALCILSFAYIYWLAGLMGLSVLAMVALHELGHLFMAKYLGYKTGGFYFLPGLGGVALLKEPVKSFWDGFLIWFAGPLSGFLQVLAVMIINYFVQSQFIWIMAFLWAAINIFNLLPVIPLDGGQIFWCIGNSVNKGYGYKWIFLFFQLLGLLLIYKAAGFVWFFLIALFGWETIRQNKILLPFVIQMSQKQIVFSIFLYLLLVGLLILLTSLSTVNAIK